MCTWCRIAGDIPFIAVNNRWYRVCGLGGDVFMTICLAKKGEENVGFSQIGGVGN